MRSPTRMIARVQASPLHQKTKHFVGFPPEVTDGVDVRRGMARAEILVIEQGADGVFLFRYTDDREPLGDTWHLSVGDAKEQAEFEYGAALSQWESIPLETDNSTAFPMRRLGNRGSGA